MPIHILVTFIFKTCLFKAKRPLKKKIHNRRCKKRTEKKLQVDPARREPAQALRAEFEGSMGKLGPLRERIRQTDELIDATVNRLYGLKQEEIAIVEGNADEIN